MDALLKILSLRTHPFRPETDLDGKPFDPPFAPGAWNGPLNPTKDHRVLPFYYDLYDWQKSTLIRRILPDQLFESFPAKSDIVDSGPIMVMITGSDSTGRVSLQNLILHKIKRQYGEEPLVVGPDLGKNLTENLNSIRAMFQFQYDQQVGDPTNAQLEKARLVAAGNPEGKLSDEAYTPLFKMWRQLVSKVCKKPFVLVVIGGEHGDMWRRVYGPVSALFDFMIVITKSEGRATSCDRLLKLESRNSVVIKAQPLKLDVAKHYVQKKLETQRIGQVVISPLAPFAENVIDVLYERGATAEQEDVVSWGVGWLNRTLGRALDKHLEKLTERQNAGTDLSTLTVDELLIDKAAIVSARDELNEGQ